MATCKECGGTGEIDCIQCYGSGRHGNYPNPEDCAHCGGSGKQTCPVCGGSGEEQNLP